MPKWFQATTYRTDDFINFLRAYYTIAPCLLCSRVHRLYVHYYVGRLIRDPGSERNVEIVIAVIICYIAKSEGKQYTKRMLPPFVTPECNITLEHTLRMVTQMPEGAIDYECAGTFLGTFCKRTIQHHYHMLVSYTEIAVRLLAEYLARVAPFIDQAGTPPYHRLFSLFLALTQTVNEAQVRRSGVISTPPPQLWYLHPVYVNEKSRSPRKNLLNLASNIHAYFDTS